MNEIGTATTDAPEAIVIGANSGIARALCKRWDSSSQIYRVHAVSRVPTEGAQAGSVSEHARSDRLLEYQCDQSEDAITETIASIFTSEKNIARIVIALGTLHGDDYQPEKSVTALSASAMEQVYRINCVLPLVWLAKLAPRLRTLKDCRIAVLSARVGSITDNELGGWWSYRSSKAALNMALKCSAIEFSRRAKGVKLLAYHPGTVDTALSAPFQRNVASNKLFDTNFAAESLDRVMDSLSLDGKISFLDWQGKPIPW
ncbi:MAG: SDR family NAD(P)-dependent oxidoreductase [Pseudomonadota bacterium]